MKDFLKKNIVEIIAIIAVTQFVVTSLWTLFHQVKSSDSTTIMILAQSSGIAIMVVSFYFGSSKGSKDKQAILDKDKDPAIQN